MKFPYQRYEGDPSPTLPDGVLYRPEVLVRVIGLAGDASFFALADTGADETLLPRSIGEAIGAKVDDSQTWAVAGFGGQEVTVALGEVTFEIGSGRRKHRWTAKIGLVNFPDPTAEVAVLGHVGFFDRFTARFDSKVHELTITANRPS